jgi:predicted transcriptional regulator
MSTIAEIKSAVERLPVDDRLALFHWLEETEAVRVEKHRLLLTEIDAGLAEADRGELIPAETVLDHLRNRARGAA